MVSFCRLFVGILPLLFLASSAFSQSTYTWTSTGTGFQNNLWTNGLNWTAGTGGTQGLDPDGATFATPITVIFNGTGISDTTIVGSITITNLSLTNTGSTTAHQTISGGSLILTQGGTISTANGASGTISSNITLSSLLGNTSFSNGGSGLAISGNITGGLSTGTTTFSSSSATNPVVVSGTNTYLGATIVSGGGLQLDGSIASLSTTTVNSGATLTGIGSITGNLTVSTGGTLTPGNSTSPTGTLSAGSTIISGTYVPTISGTSSSLLSAGALTINAGSSIDLTGLAPTSGTTYELISYTSILGAFTNVTNAPANFAISYDTPFQIDLVPVPEPASTAAIVGLAGAGVFAFRRRRQFSAPAAC